MWHIQVRVQYYMIIVNTAILLNLLCHTKICKHEPCACSYAIMHSLVPNTRLYFDIFVGFHVTMKMKRAAVSLVESSTENVKRRKSFSKRHSKFISVLTHCYYGIIFVCTMQFYSQSLLTVALVQLDTDQRVHLVERNWQCQFTTHPPNPAKNKKGIKRNHSQN